MANLMTCWKEHEFQDTACAPEIKAFIACTAQAAAVGCSFLLYHIYDERYLIYYGK